MYTLEQKLKIVQLWYETKSPAEVRRRVNTHQGHKSKSECAALTNLKIQRIVQHFEKEKTLDHVHKLKFPLRHGKELARISAFA